MVDAIAFEHWLMGRPQAVQDMARRFPPGTKLLIHGQEMHVISYLEDGALTVSAVDPSVDYQLAVGTRQHVCNCCVGKLDELVIKEPR